MAQMTYAQALALARSDPSSLLTALVAGMDKDGNTAGAAGSPAASTDVQTSVASSATSVAILAANTSRLSASIVNESSATLYIKYGTTASLTSYKYAIPPGATWDMPYRYTGKIDGIWSSANGNARIGEST